jgi:hypothetical protein
MEIGIQKEAKLILLKEIYSCNNKPILIITALIHSSRAEPQWTNHLSKLLLQ